MLYTKTIYRLMPPNDSEVPSDLQAKIDSAESGGRSLSLLDAHPPEEWHACPNCDERLHAQATITDAADDLVAVEYACAGPDHCGALWVWGTADDELYYRGESEVTDPFDGDE